MDAIPDEARRFVLTSVPSVPYLEAMLLFFRDPEVMRDASSVAEEIYVAERAAADLLRALRDARIVASAPDAPGSFRYAPATAALSESIAALSLAYASNLVAVTNLIHDSTQRNAHRFADAFKFRKDS